MAHVAVGGGLALLLLPLALRLPNAVVADDGYFYAQIAWSLGTIGQSTFDGIHTTSGYHWPWAVILAGLTSILRVVTVDKTVHLYAYLALSLAIASATAHRFFATNLFRVTAFVVLVASFSLTEMVIAAPVVLALLENASRAATSRVASSRWERALAFALPLIRIDLCCIPLLLAVALVRRERKRGVMLFAATLAGMAVQLVTMKLLFGHYVGVAAWLKAPAPSLVGVLENVRFNLIASPFQDALLIAHVAFVALALVIRRDRTAWVLAGASLCFVAMHTALSLLRGWYLVPSTIAVSFTLEWAVRTGRSSRTLERVAQAFAATLALALLVHGIRVERVYAADQRIASTFLAELRARLPQGAAIYTSDNPGYLGFFSGMRIVDGDGLVNDFDYAHRLREGTLAGYLDEERICHVVVAEADEDPILDVAGLVLHRTDVAFMYAIRRSQRSQADFALYRLSAERCAAHR